MTKIPASTCGSEVCSDWFDIASSLCAQSTNVTVTASATNLLGEGPPSQPIEIILLLENGMDMYAFSSSCTDYCLIAYFAEVAGCQVYETLNLRFIVFTTLSSATNILLLASIVVIVIVLVIKRRKDHRDANAGNERTETTAVYEEINLHPPSSTIIDTRVNVAYRQNIFS